MYKPFNIGDSFRLIDPDTPRGTTDRSDIIMARGAFGSGEHETTASCIELLESLPDLAGQKVLDLGSGTAILSIAAIKLGAARALCVDIAEAAVASAQHNCQLNDIGTAIEHRCGTLEVVSETGYDLILANIYGDILLMVSKPLAARLKPGGTLLLSGILWEYNFDVRQAYERQGCEVVKNLMLEEFSTVLMKKEKGLAP